MRTLPHMLSHPLFGACCRARKPLTTNPLELARVQQPDPISRLDSGVDIMAMLQTCFQGQQKPRTTVYLSGGDCACHETTRHVTHLLQAGAILYL